MCSLIYGCATHLPNNIYGKAVLDTTKPIRVEIFEFNPKAAVDVNTYAVENLGLELAEKIASELLSMGLQPATVNSNNNISEDIGYIIKGRILEVNGGSAMKRVWIGFGSGATTVTVKGEITNAKSGALVRNFTLTKQSNWTYSNNETAVRENINEIAIDIAKIFESID